jgi:homoserine kinase
MQSKPFRVVSPASTSNVGAGFDVLSAALNLHLRLDVEPARHGRIEWAAGWDLPVEENMLDRALKNTLRSLGARRGARLSMDNPIPLKRGLGSSGAAIIAGVKIAERLAGTSLSAAQVCDLAFPLEGHPENLAASWLGGWTLSWVEAGTMRAERLQSDLFCRFVAASPEVSVSTVQARRILPKTYSRADCVFNLQRCGLLVHALHSGQKRLLREAVQDRIHQPYRARLVPGLSDLLALRDLPEDLSQALLAVFISGSGSTVIALADSRFEEIGAWMVETLGRCGTPAVVRVFDLDTQGARIVSYD